MRHDCWLVVAVTVVVLVILVSMYNIRSIESQHDTMITAKYTVDDFHQDVENTKKELDSQRKELEQWKVDVEKNLKSEQRNLEVEQKNLKVEQKNLKVEQRKLEVEQLALKNQLNQLQQKEETLEKLNAAAEREEQLEKLNAAAEREAVLDNQIEDRDSQDADPAQFEGLQSADVRTRYPGITLLPQYKLQPFLLPDPQTGKTRTIEDISENEAEERYFGLLNTRHVTCDNMVRMGHAGDGGWDICGSQPYLPRYSGNCLVYSFGINNDFSFDDAMANTYNCQVRSFDPSMKVADYKRSERVWFYQLGLGETKSVNKLGWKLDTLGGILSKAGHLESSMDVLKMDIEYNEWSCLRTMLKEGVLRHVHQFVLEVHTPEVQAIHHTSTREDFQQMADLLVELERLGFRRFHYHLNPFRQFTSKRSGKQRACCYELSYINIALLKKT